MAADIPPNPLLSSQKTSDSGLQIGLHPLVLLTISDYITRHTLRQEKGPVVGALLGQQNGLEITIEHAFDCLLQPVDNGEIILNQAWFDDRLQQMKDVHKVPQLDLVGWYTTLPTTGPQPCNLPIHHQILQNYNESALFLGFHPTAVLEGSVGGKLPLTIYESNFETDDAPVQTGEDSEMRDGEPKLGLKFKELPYTIETGEAEFISTDFVARGGGNATAVDGTVKKPDPKPDPKADSSSTVSPEKIKGKGKTKKSEDAENEIKFDDQSVLSREDEEQIAALTAKANAIKMLDARINLIATYLQELPPSYVSDDTDLADKEYTPVNHEVLRSVQALLGRLALLIPADSTSFEQELTSEQNDVGLVGLLTVITSSLKDARDLGKKYSVIEAAKSSRSKIPDRTMSWDPYSEEAKPIFSVGDLLG